MNTWTPPPTVRATRTSRCPKCTYAIRPGQYTSKSFELHAWVHTKCAGSAPWVPGARFIPKQRSY